MKHTSIVAPSADGLAEPIDRALFTAPDMGKSFPNSETRTMKDTSEHRPATRVPAGYIDSMHTRPVVGTTYTLRVKPDRRRAQAPIPPGTDRRRSR
jgi:hypothetical protein